MLFGEMMNDNFMNLVKTTWQQEKFSEVHFAQVCGNLAMSCDGVEDKLRLCQYLNRYDTIGIDCVAIVANDLICTGAKPMHMMDYIKISPSCTKEILYKIGEGLLEGAKLAGMSISGGETSVMDSDFILHELVGFGVGLVPADKLIPNELQVDDEIVGIESSGVHCSGLSHAIDLLGPDYYKELLTPTHIYVNDIEKIISGGVTVHGLFNNSGGGLHNLARSSGGVDMYIDSWPELIPEIFDIIEAASLLGTQELYRMFNMGIGFFVVGPKGTADQMAKILPNRTHLLGKTVPLEN